MFEVDPSWPTIVELAVKRWGDPTAIRRGELRFGSRGSKSVLIQEQVWTDHEDESGGGYVAMYNAVYPGQPLPPRTNGHAPATDITYDYVDADGTLLFQVVRKPPGLAGPRFVQRHPDGAGGWVWNLRGVRRVLYRLPEVLAADEVLIPEGEKDVDNLFARGFVATTNPGGAGKWHPSFSAALRGKRCIILPDNDDAGRRHAEMVFEALKPLASVRIVNLPGLPPKGDVSDWFEGGHTADDLRRLLSAPSPPPVEDPRLPTIRVLSGLRHLAADAGMAAMAEAAVPFYQRDRQLVRAAPSKAKAADGKVVEVPALVPVTLPVLSRALGSSAQWEKVTKDGEPIRIDPPKEVVEQIAALSGLWPFPPVSGVIGTPTMRPDGSLLLEPGYDAATGLVLVSPPKIPAIPERPSRASAEAALALLKSLLSEFPLSDDFSQSVALSLLLTPVLRGALGAAVPMHVVTAPAPGTGKSYLQDVASVLATGERCAVIAVSSDENENEKRLIGAALAGFPIIAIDNCNGTLSGDFLAQVTERPILQLRALGSSAVVRIPNTFTTFANGNNIAVAADMVRRSIMASLDANQENPENREFSFDPVAAILEDRGRFLAACLTIARAYHVADYPDAMPRIPSFERWSDLVRSALVWLGCADPAATTATARAEDPSRTARAAIFEEWAKTLTIGVGYTSSELTAHVETFNGSFVYPEFRDALLSVAKSKNADRVDPLRLGIFLAKSAKVVIGKHKLSVDRSNPTRQRFSLVPS